MRTPHPSFQILALQAGLRDARPVPRLVAGARRASAMVPRFQLHKTFGSAAAQGCRETRSNPAIPDNGQQPFGAHYPRPKRQSTRARDNLFILCVESQFVAFERRQSAMAGHLVAELRKLVCRILIQEPAHVHPASRRPERRIAAFRDRTQPASTAGSGTRLEPCPPAWAVRRASKEMEERT
jgi:hypothetical protein